MNNGALTNGLDAVLRHPNVLEIENFYRFVASLREVIGDQVTVSLEERPDLKFVEACLTLIRGTTSRSEAADADYDARLWIVAGQIFAPFLISCTEGQRAQIINAALGYLDSRRSVMIEVDHPGPCVVEPLSILLCVFEAESDDPKHSTLFTEPGHRKMEQSLVACVAAYAKHWEQEDYNSLAALLHQLAPSYKSVPLLRAYAAAMEEVRSQLAARDQLADVAEREDPSYLNLPEDFDLGLASFDSTVSYQADPDDEPEMGDDEEAGFDGQLEVFAMLQRNGEYLRFWRTLWRENPNFRPAAIHGMATADPDRAMSHFFLRYTNHPGEFDGDFVAGTLNFFFDFGLVSEEETPGSQQFNQFFDLLIEKLAEMNPNARERLLAAYEQVGQGDPDAQERAGIFRRRLREKA